MKYTLHILATALFLLSASCKTVGSKSRTNLDPSPGKNGGQNYSSEVTKLDGTWLSRCIPRAPSVYGVTKLVFAEGEISLTSTYYSDAKCTAAAGAALLAAAKINPSIVAKGTFSLSAEDANKIHEIDLEFSKGSAYTIAKIEGNTASFGKICKAADVAKGTCKAQAGYDAAHRSREWDPAAVYSRK